MTIAHSSDSPAERGSIFFYILIGVVLLAAISYAIATSMRGNSTGISDQQAKLMASDIIASGNRVAEAVSRMRYKDISKADISFENGVVTNYVNPTCTTGSCKIFDPEGGGLSWEDPPSGSQTTPVGWGYTGNITLANVGPNSPELIAVLPNLTKEVCMAIDTLLDVPLTSGNPSTIIALPNINKFVGTYSSSISLGTITTKDKSSLCIRVAAPNGTALTGMTANAYVYIHTLLRL